MLRFAPACQSYDWGKRGNASMVGRLAKSAAGDGFDLVENRPYAELWMGTHPSGPARVYPDLAEDRSTLSANASIGGGPQSSPVHVLLSDWLKEHPEAVGTVPAGYKADDLPLLFKVLSINTALSIQAHPDRTLATELHRNFPTIYKDGNHKPEMAIALTPMECMNGFRPLTEIINHLELVPELASILGESVVSQLKDICKKVTGETSVWRDRRYSSSGMANVVAQTEEQIALTERALRLFMSTFLNAEDQLVTTHLTALITRLEYLQTLPESDEQRFLPFLCKLMLRLHKDYPGDRGVFFPLVLNTAQLRPGEAFYIVANEPHAYISGDLMECMALSDNVVRVGLTPKFKDKETLERMLSYRAVPVTWCKMQTLDSYTMLYRPPTAAFPEFEVERISLSSKQTYEISALACGSILIITQFTCKGVGDNGGVLECDGKTIPIPAAGTCFYQVANQAVQIRTGPGSEIVLYRAHINLG